MPLSFVVRAVDPRGAPLDDAGLEVLAYVNGEWLANNRIGAQCVLRNVGAAPALRVRLLAPAAADDVEGEETAEDLGVALFDGPPSAWAQPRPVVFMPVREPALLRGAEVWLAVEQVHLQPDGGPDAPLALTPAKPPTHDVLEGFVKNSTDWWNDGRLSGRALPSRDGPKPVPRSRFAPLYPGAFDIHCPVWDVPETGLPGWALALPLARNDDPDWLHSLLALAAARLGYSEGEMHQTGVAYLASLRNPTRDPAQPPAGALRMLEFLLEACAAPASFCSYLEDRSSGRSHRPVERYSLSPRYGAAGDCEDLAKLMQTVGESFAGLRASKGRASPPECVLAAADLAQRVLFGICIVGANEGSFARHAAKSETNARFGDHDRSYDSFLSHMVCVAVPRARLLGAPNAEADPAAGPPAEAWEASLPSCVLEGTGLKSVFADNAGATSCSRLRAGAPTLAQPLRKLKRSSEGFYRVMQSFSCARGVQYVDPRGGRAPCHELMFTVPGAGQPLYGVDYLDFVGADLAAWSVRATVHDLSARAVAAAAKEVRRRLDARCVLPLADVAPRPGTRERFERDVEARIQAASAGSGLLRSVRGGALVPAWGATPPPGAAVAFVRANALTSDNLRSLLGRGASFTCALELCTDALWGLIVWAV